VNHPSLGLDIITSNCSIWESGLASVHLEQFPTAHWMKQRQSRNAFFNVEKAGHNSINYLLSAYRAGSSGRSGCPRLLSDPLPFFNSLQARYTPTIVPSALIMPITIPAISPPLRLGPTPPFDPPLGLCAAGSSVMVECSVTITSEGDAAEVARATGCQTRKWIMER
jgi:hypothetical protein